MYCSKCGSTIAPNTAYCQICGIPAPVDALLSAPAPTIPQASSAAGVSPHWLPPVSRSYAGFWLRFVAHLLDGFLVGMLFIAICVPILFLTGLGAALRSVTQGQEPDPAVIATFVSSIVLLIGVSLLGTWLYYAYFESSEWQATVGKKVLNLVVTDLNGNRVSFARASGRFFAKILSGFIPLGIGYILAGITEKKQALHDMIAGCLVFRS
jgi:uncharacterized RDD family membrane protein YckC